MVVNGDTTQIDLGIGRRSGLMEAMEVLRDTPGVGIVRLTEQDVVRHDLVQAIVSAYERYASAKREGKTDDQKASPKAGTDTP